MNEPAHDLCAVPVGGIVLLYAPRRQLAALVNPAAATELGASLRAGAPATDDLAPLWRHFSAAPPPLVDNEEIAPAFLGIVPTRRCNMACVYCDFGSTAAPAATLDLGRAAAVVDWMAARMKESGRESLPIHFFGGEPLLAPDVLSVVVHRGRLVAAQLDLDPHFEVTTNGVIGEEWADFLADYFQSVVLSIDGPPHVQNAQRPLRDGRGSSRIVAKTASRLAQSPVDLCLRVCVSQLNVALLASIVDEFDQRYAPTAIDFETVIAGPGAAAAGLGAPDPLEFARGYVKACRAGEDRGVRVVYGAADHAGPRSTSCPVGCDAVIVLPDGRLGGCYLPPEHWPDGLDLAIGQATPDGAVRIDAEAMRRLRAEVRRKPRCERCFCRWSCAGGCHVRQTPPDAGLAYNDFCVQTRLVTACRLLDELDRRDLVDRLLSDARAARDLAHCDDDRLIRENASNA